MPVLMAATGISVKTECICAVTNSGATAKTSCTPTVFWAVREVMALQPYTPSAAKVFRSAWIPAPPPLSLPATVKAMGKVWELEKGFSIGATNRYSTSNGAGARVPRGNGPEPVNSIKLDALVPYAGTNRIRLYGYLSA